MVSKVLSLLAVNPSRSFGRAKGGVKIFIYGMSCIYLLMLFSCGEGIIEIGKSSYEPKIVIEGFLFPNRPVRNIRLTRNFPLNTEIDVSNVILSDADVAIIDNEGRRFPLIYSHSTFAFNEIGLLKIASGKSYTLEVKAKIDGVALKAQSTTTVPFPGLQIDTSASLLGRMKYRERGENDELKRFQLVFDRSPGTNFYALALTALNADTSTFVYDNPFEEFDPGEVLDDLDNFKHRFSWIQDTPLATGQSDMEIFWFDLWFYSDYQAVIYAGDRNFKDFLTTHDQVQELDGNFHEPVLHIEGDGIGVFASAVADTVYFTVTRE